MNSALYLRMQEAECGSARASHAFLAPRNRLDGCIVSGCSIMHEGGGRHEPGNPALSSLRKWTGLSKQDCALQLQRRPRSLDARFCKGAFVFELSPFGQQVTFVHSEQRKLLTEVPVEWRREKGTRTHLHTLRVPRRSNGFARAYPQPGRLSSVT